MTTLAPQAPIEARSTTEEVANAVVGRVEIVGYERSPSDVLRLITFAVASLLLTALARWAEDAVLGLEEDVVALLAFISPTIERVLAGATQLLTSLGLLAMAVLTVVARRYRLLGYLAVAALATPLVVLVDELVRRGRLERAVNEVADRAGISATAFPDLWGIALVTAAFVVSGPFVTGRWRRAGAVVLGLLVFLELLLSVELPVSLFLTVALGGTIGSAILLAFGRPDTRPRPSAVTGALRRSGLDLVALEPAKVDARGSTPFFGRLGDGRGIFAKVLGADQRSADLLFRLYRFVRLKNVGDERPFSSLRRTVEHEALVSLQARDVGVRTPRMRAIAATDGDALLLAYDRIGGRSLDAVDPATIDDQLLVGLWEQVSVLRRHRIAHRDLRRANVFVDEGGEPWVIDFGFAEVAASDALLDADVAQLLAATTLAVGPARAVDTAVAVLGPGPVAEAIPRLQPNALSGATRSAFRHRHGLLGELRETAAHRAGVDPPPLEHIDRFSGRTLFMVAMLAAVTYFLLPQFADLPGIVEQVKHASWEWLPAAVACSVLTYVGATVALMGSVPDRLRPGPTSAAQLGSSFASKLAPASVGGLALNVRYLQKGGVDPAVAVAGVGLNSLGGMVVHVVLMLLFVVWAGRSAFGSMKLPRPEILLLGLGAVLVVAGATLAVPAVRHALATRLVPLLRRSAGGVGVVLRRPGKLALLLGGSLLVTSSYLACSFFATRAFDGRLSLAVVGAIYLAGSAVATAAPTPGGLGALEAALIAGLVAAGMPNTTAVPSVFLYRLVTFWLPILPGWICFTMLKRRGYL